MKKNKIISFVQVILKVKVKFPTKIFLSVDQPISKDYEIQI